MHRTKIVATLGPASERVETLTRLVRAGADVIRLNLSHGQRPDLERRLAAIAQVRAQTGQAIGVLLDTRGPEIRIGAVAGGQLELQEGQALVLTAQPADGSGGRIHVGYARLARDVRVGSVILLDDGNLELDVLAVEGADVHCRVRAGGTLLSGKKLTIPDASLDLPVLLPQDEEDIRFGVAWGIDFVAASFINSAADVHTVRRVIEAAGGDALVIAKIETRQGFNRIAEILEAADGIMVARGDLGVECPPEEVPLMQKELIRRCNEAGKPVITATQMLESMIQFPRPTRAEAADVANAILDGTDAVMLSAETAVGHYPVEAVQTMARIAVRTEAALPYREMLAAKAQTAHRSVTDAISYATVSAALNLGASAVITATESGHTARMVAKHRPQSPILAMTPNPKVQTRLTVVWGVRAFLMPQVGSTDAMIEQAVGQGLDLGLIQEGDLVVITAGVPVGVPGSTNLIKVHTVGDVLLRGTGVGQRSGSGRVRRVLDAQGAAALQAGEVLVAVGTERDMVPAMRQAAAIITEEGGLTSHAAVVGLSLGVPVVVGAVKALEILHDGEEVTVDARRGLIYRGRARTL